MTAHNIHVSFSRLWFFQPVLRRDVGVVGKPPRSPVMSRRSCGSPVRGQNFSPSHRVGSMCTLCEMAHLTQGKFSFLSFQSIPALRIMSFTVFDLGIHCLSAVLSIFAATAGYNYIRNDTIHTGIHLCQRMATRCFRTQYHSISTIWRNAESVNKGYS